MRVWLCLRLGLGGGSPSRSVHFSIVNNIRKVLALYEVKCPLAATTIKKSHGRGNAEPRRIRLESENFGRENYAL